MNAALEFVAPTAAAPAQEPETPVPAIDIRRVTKWFDHKDGDNLTVLKDISIAVPAGSITAIVGSSGCGKSTLLNIVSGLIAADRGSVLLNGVASGKFDDWRSISYMFQEDRLLPWRTTMDNVCFGLEATDTPRAQRRELAADVLKLVGLDGFKNAYPHQLSGGMRSRVALARCLVGNPEILLMDEPFSKLDPTMRTQMHEEVLRIKQLRNMTVMFVTHDIEEAVALADRVVVLLPRPGRVRESVEIALARPRVITSPEFSEQVRQLRVLI